MYYYLYEIRNKINNKIYVGVHKTKNLEDGYMGSGSYLAKAKIKYGIENFDKTILQFFNSYDELLLAESNVVNHEFLSRDDVYNLVLGGIGNGFEYINANGLNLYGKNGKSGCGLENLANQSPDNKLKDILIERGTWEEYKLKISSAILKLYENGYVNPFKNKTHSHETKMKIGLKSAVHQLGTKNSQYGTRWVHSPELKISKKIKGEIEYGWVYGKYKEQKPKIIKEDTKSQLVKEHTYFHINNFISSKYDSIREYCKNEYEYSHVTFTNNMRKYLIGYDNSQGSHSIKEKLKALMI